jgi:predicted RNA binding protein YcfA (HicA-like mRNA interferase family)
MTAKEALKLLKHDGWYEKTQKGSHLQLIHPLKHGKITLPIHSGDLKPATLHSILKLAGLK